MIRMKYVCDYCHKDVESTEDGLMYGPLCLIISAPNLSHKSVDVHFCSINHSTNWIEKNLPTVFS